MFLSAFFRNKIVELLHSVGTVLSHSLCHMAIYIQSELSGCVTQVCLHGFYVVTGRQRADCEAVPQIMEAGIISNASTLGNLLEMLDHSPANKVLSQCIGTNEIKWIVPNALSLLLHGQLFLVLSIKCFHNQRCRQNNTMRSILILFSMKGTACPAGLSAMAALSGTSSVWTGEWQRKLQRNLFFAKMNEKCIRLDRNKKVSFIGN